MTDRCLCIHHDPEIFGDTHRDEPRIEWTEQYLGNRITFRAFPHHWARVLVARRTQDRYRTPE